MRSLTKPILLLIVMIGLGGAQASAAVAKVMNSKACEARLLVETSALFPLYSERLRLRPTSAADSALLRPLLNDPEIYHNYLLIPPGCNLSSFVLLEGHLCRGVHLSGWNDENLKAMLAVFERESGALVGVASLTQSRQYPRHWMVSYAVKGEKRRQGYGREVVRTLIGHVRAREPDAVFWAQVVPSNQASANLLESVGFVKRDWPNELCERRRSSDMYELAPP